MLKKLLLYFVSIFVPGVCFANPIPLFSDSINTYKLNQKIENDSCKNYQRHGYLIRVDPKCILFQEIPNLSLEDKIDALWNHIQSFSTGYQSDKDFVTYTAGDVQLIDTKYLYPLSQRTKNILYNAIASGYSNIDIPLFWLAPYIKDDLAFFVSKKDISKLLPCTKHNYFLAFKNLDGNIIKAGTSFNFNHYLFGLNGYCRGLSEDNLKFYGGVCGVASQLFRSALMNPLLSIPTRWNHNEWFSVYYGEQVQGDDASVYENSKQLIIENNSPYNIVLKTFAEDNQTYIILVTEKDAIEGQRVEISKKYINPLNIELSRNIYTKQEIDTGHPFSPLLPQWIHKNREISLLLDSQIFQSHYIGINSNNR